MNELKGPSKAKSYAVEIFDMGCLHFKASSEASPLQQAAYSMITDWACGDRGAAVVRLGLGLSLTPVVSRVARIVTAFSPRTRTVCTSFSDLPQCARNTTYLISLSCTLGNFKFNSYN